MEKFTNFIAFLCLAGVGVLGQENVFQCNSCVDAECQRTEQQQCNSSCYVTFKPGQLKKQSVAIEVRTLRVLWIVYQRWNFTYFIYFNKIKGH